MNNEFHFTNEEYKTYSNLRILCGDVCGGGYDVLTHFNEVNQSITDGDILVVKLTEEINSLYRQLYHLSKRREIISRCLWKLTEEYESKYQNTYFFKRTLANKTISKKRIRRAVLLKSNGLCVFCGSDKHITIDHIKPVKLGGTNDISNLQALCRKCNSRKGAKFNQ